VRAFLAELHRRDRLLSRVAWAHVALAALFVAAMTFDERTILGANPWVKPFKFAVSVAIYLFSVAWLRTDGGGGGLRRAVLPRLGRLAAAGPRRQAAAFLTPTPQPQASSAAAAASELMTARA